jgi:thiol-disulfide isomerase/thioredoxin
VIARLAAAALMVSSPAGARAAEGPALRAIEQHHGKVLVLNFWAGWCAPCASEIPLLARIHRDYSARGVQVVGASIDEPESRDAARDLARKLRVNYPVLYGASSAEMSSLELATAIPATAIFDRDGRRAFRLAREEAVRQDRPAASQPGDGTGPTQPGGGEARGLGARRPPLRLHREDGSPLQFDLVRPGTPRHSPRARGAVHGGEHPASLRLMPRAA